MTIWQALRPLLLAFAILLPGCQPTPAPAPPPTSYQAPAADLNHDVYIATDRDLTLYRAVDSGLLKVRTVTQPQDATVDLGVSHHGALLWRDGDWFGYSPDLDLITQRSLGQRFTYAEYQLSSSPTAILADLDRKMATVGPDLKVSPPVSIPGVADDIIIHDETAYILDPTMNSHYLVRIDLSEPKTPRLIDQVKFYEGPLSKGTHWLDLQASQWLVLMKEELLVFELANLSSAPLRIPCRQQFDMKRLDGGGPFRLWKAIDQSPLWALGHDSGLAVARLEKTSQGLAVAQRLDLTPSSYPLMSPPFIEQAGSRLYASDGGDLWIIDITGARPSLVDVMHFRYGLHLVTIPRRI